ncbi:MAG: hypothetical protein VX944_15705 [Myxococcota bacterium]|nr:hypothetical protein [Myxococcota bacterium]
MMAPALALGDEPTPQQTGPESVEVDADAALPTGRDRLYAAVGAYQRGDGETAKLALARLINDPTVADEQLRQQARVYLGEVLYLQQNEEEARRVFEAVLTLDPTFTIDPFAHPPDVCGFFETVRAYIVTPTATALQAQSAVPSSAYLGFGLYHQQHGQHRKATTIAILQSTLGVISVLGFAGLMEARRYQSGDDALNRLKIQRSVQWGSTAAFYGVWGWSIADAQRHWRSGGGIKTQGSPDQSERDFGVPARLHFGLAVPIK